MTPEGWEDSLLDNAARRRSGHTPDKTKPHYWNGGIKWVSLADSSKLDDGIISETDKEISSDGLANSSAVLLPSGTVVLSRDAGVGKSAILGDDMAVSQHFIAWTCDEASKLDNWFLYYWMQMKKPLFERMAVGSTIKTIGLPFFKKLRLTHPPLPEQRKIADILSAWDAAIEKTEALLATAKAQKRALMQSLLTGKRRFHEFEGQPWIEVRLGDVASIYDGTHATPKYVEHGVPFYSVEHLTKDQFSNTKYISEDVFEKENKRVKLERGDILMSRIGDVGTTRLIDWDVRASFYVSLALIKSVEDVSSEYLAQYMNSQDFQAELWKRMIHVAFPKKINLGEIGNCVVKLPSRKEQVRIAKALGDLDMEIKCRKSEVTKLRSEKKALMQQLLTGKRRVSV